MNVNIKKQYAALILIDVILFGIGIWFAVFHKDYSMNQKEESYLIGASYMTMNNEFYKIMSEEISARDRKSTRLNSSHRT